MTPACNTQKTPRLQRIDLNSQWTAGVACRHLGLAGDPARHAGAPSADHRCYLWQQQDRIDRAHQARFCLTSMHAGCPWLMLPRPGGRARRRPGVRSGVAKTMLGSAAVIALAAFLAAVPHLTAGALPRAPRAAPAAMLPVSSPAPTGQTESTDPRLLPAGALTAGLLTADAPGSMTIAVPVETGGAFVAGNVGVSLPSAALARLDGPVTVTIERRPASVPVPVAPWRVSSRGTMFQMMISDAHGTPVTTFPAPVTLLLKYSGEDLAMADGNPDILTAGFVIDSRSPSIANPVHFPAGTWLFFPPSATWLDEAEGTVRVETQAAPRVLGVMTRPYGEVLVADQAGLYSDFRQVGKLFGTRSAGTRLQVAGPQVGARLLIRDPQTSNYAYVNAADVSPVLP